MAETKRKCEVASPIACNGQCVTKLVGVKKGAPEFYCCIGCRAIMSRWGIKTKEVAAK